MFMNIMPWERGRVYFNSFYPKKKKKKVHNKKPLDMAKENSAVDTLAKP